MQLFNLSMNLNLVEQMNNSTARLNMVKQQLRTNNILDEHILDLYDVLPRHEFVPEQYKAFAYSDMQIPLSNGQIMLTPLEECIMLQALQLVGNETVLEVGTGTGFFTALLSKLCKKVLSVELYPEFITQASAKLQAHHCDNVELIQGDASRGWLEKAPYDVIVFTGAMDKITQTQKLQIVPGGKICSIEGHAPVMKAYLHSLDHHGHWTHKNLFSTEVPQLVDHLKPSEFVF